MPRTPGETVGPYKLLSLIGEGGMGQVFSASDQRLGRIVAIKFLKEQFNARFEREARAIAQISHPHVCALFDVGPDYLVMEYLEGKPLTGPLPFDKLIEYTGQICDALEQAHRKGIAHRDLKPANILVTAQGIKLLDFGLAKRSTVPAAGLPADEQATATAPITSGGFMLGTPGYMAPEQIEGKDADGRSDIFSLGAVLYYLATGRQAFQRKSIPATLAATLHEEPEGMGSGAPPGFDRLMRRCIRKEPDERFQSAFDIKLSLETIAQLPRPETAPAHRSPRNAVAWIGWTVAVLCAAAALLPWLASRATAPGPGMEPLMIRSVIPVTPAEYIAGSSTPAAAISPDGRTLAFAGYRSNGTQLYLRSLSSLSVQPLAGTEGASGPFFSPNGEWLGFFSAGKLRKIQVRGGPPVTICEIEGGRGATWGPDDTIVLNPSSGFGVGLSRVSASGGRLEQLTQPDLAKNENSHRWPQFLPGGKRVLFTIWADFATARLAILELASGKIRTLIEPGTYGRFASGYLVFARREGLMIAPFDPASGSLRANPAPAGIEVWANASNGAAQFDIASGFLLYAPGVSTTRSTMVLMDRNGGETALNSEPDFYHSPNLTPDGRHIIVSKHEAGNFDLWRFELARSTFTRLTSAATAEYYSISSPDGTEVTFSSNRGGPPNLFSIPADGSGAERRLTSAPNPQMPTGWSPDGLTLAFDQFDPKTKSDIWLYTKQDGNTRPFLQTPFSEGSAVFSPDGDWVAYSSDESGRGEIYIRPRAGKPGGKIRVSAEGGQHPLWSPRGGELFYWNRERNLMMAVQIETHPALKAGLPKQLFRLEGPPNAGGRPYDADRDGKRFVMLKSYDTLVPPAQFHLVSNGLNRLVDGK